MQHGNLVTKWQLMISLLRFVLACLVSVPVENVDIRSSAYLDCSTSAEWTSFRYALGNGTQGYAYNERVYGQALYLFDKYYRSVDLMNSRFMQEQVCRPEIRILTEEVLAAHEFYGGELDGDRFCFVGFISAAFYIAIHRMPFDAASSQELLQLGASLLGKELAFDYFRSTNWPLVGLDLFLNLDSDETAAFVTAADIFDLPIHKAVGIADLYSFDKPTKPQVDAICSRSHANEKTSTVAVIGTHGSLSREPVDWLHEVCGKGANRVQVRYFGLEKKWCTLMPSLCDESWEGDLSELLDRVEKKGDFTWDSLRREVAEIVTKSAFIRAADFFICTEPLTVCLMILEIIADEFDRRPFMVGYFGVALLNLLPYGETENFWRLFDRFVLPGNQFVAASNAPLVSEQFFYQSGVRFPSIRPFARYAQAATPIVRNTGLAGLKKAFVWKSSIASFGTFRCVVDEIRFANPRFNWSIDFMERRTEYSEVAAYDAVILLPWDTAIMTFYEFYSLGIPIFMPSEKFSIYQFTHTRGQLTVGEPHYRSIRPGHQPYSVRDFQVDQLPERSRSDGMKGLKVAQQLMENLLTKLMKSTDVDEMRNFGHSALELTKDMNYLLSVASDEDEDSYSSAGKITKANKQDKSWSFAKQDSDNFKHPYSPFQMTPPGGSDFTKKLAGVWWVRNDIRFQAMRYWNQFSDYELFPGVIKFDSVPDLFRKLEQTNLTRVRSTMHTYNKQTEEYVTQFWQQAFSRAFSSL